MWRGLGTAKTSQRPRSIEQPELLGPLNTVFSLAGQI